MNKSILNKTIFKTKNTIKEQLNTIEKQQKEILQLKEKISLLETKMKYIQLTSAADELFSKTETQCHTKADFNRLEFIKNTKYDINYRAYIVQDTAESFVIDIQQIPLSDKEIEIALCNRRKV